MIIIFRTEIESAIFRNPEIKSRLNTWFWLMSWFSGKTIEDLIKLFPNVTIIGKCTIFSLGAENCRVFTYIHYDKQRLYILDILVKNNNVIHDMYIQQLISNRPYNFSGSGIIVENSENESVHIRYEEILSSPVSLGYIIKNLFSKEESDTFTKINHHNLSCFSHEIKVCLERLDQPNKEPFEYLLDIATALRKYFEDTKVDFIPPPYPYEIIQLFMFLHDLRNKDLDIGSPGVTSDVIKGNRHPSKSHAQKLGKQFGVPSGIFIPITLDNPMVPSKSIINMLGSFWKEE